MLPLTLEQKVDAVQHIQSNPELFTTLTYAEAARILTNDLGFSVSNHLAKSFMAAAGIKRLPVARGSKSDGSFSVTFQEWNDLQARLELLESIVEDARLGANIGVRVQHLEMLMQDPPLASRPNGVSLQKLKELSS